MGLKKLAYNFLCNNVTGSILLKLFKRIPDVRWRGYRFFVNRPNPNKAMVSSIFFGFYESAEIRMLHKHFKGNTDVIEAGGSLGVVSSHICSLLQKDRQLVVVEANPFLKDTITANLRQYRDDNFSIVSAAIGYGMSELQFNVSDNNTESSISLNGTSAKAVRVPAVTLSKVIADASIKNYALVSDIEGAEVSFLVNDATVLQQCRQMFIELHDTKYKDRNYSVADLVTLIEQNGFRKIENDGPVYYFERKTAG